MPTPTAYDSPTTTETALSPRPCGCTSWPSVLCPEANRLYNAVHFASNACYFTNTEPLEDPAYVATLAAYRAHRALIEEY